METPQEKAKRLGLPMLEELPDHKWGIEITGEDSEQKRKLIEMLKEHENEIEAICGTCGKEITRGDARRREPCGHPECPFGVLRNDK